MRWRSILVLAIVAVASSCGLDASQDPGNQPNVTVLGTSVDSGQPSPTLGSAVSTERE